MSTSPSSNRSRHLRRLVGEQPCRSSSLLPHALPRTPGLHANGCLCSLHSAASDALCRSFPAAGAALPDAIQQVFRMFTGFFLADEMLHPAAERLNRESVLATINRAIHPALTPRLDVQRPIRGCVLFPGPRCHRRSSHVRENPIWNDAALSESRARFGRLHETKNDGSSNRASRNRCTGITRPWPNPEPGATT